MADRKLKIALVHDYIKEFGGAERVLMTLHEMFPDAPIYTAFVSPGSTAAKAFKGAKIIPSWANIFIRYFNLYSPTRFITPLIWESFDFDDYDVVILSSSWYITKPIRVNKKVKVICYCHTPPRSLYGYPTAVEWQRYWPVKAYFYIVSHFLRLYDFKGAQRVDQFIANSKNVAARIEKFYRKPSIVIYPPVDVQGVALQRRKATPYEAFYLVAGRIAGSKGVDLAMKAANKLHVRLKIVGEFAGIRFGQEEIEKLKSPNIEFLGRVSDDELYKLYAQAKAFLALGEDEDFGITPVEAMAAGTPIVAFASGGYLESVIEGQTGTFFKEYTVASLVAAMKRIDKMKISSAACQTQAKKFSKENFIKAINKVIEKYAGTS